MANQEKYQWIFENYPSTINKEQLYKICCVSKRTALAYLEFGLIPCERTGKKTHKYRIKLADVIHFLEERERGRIGFVAPSGWYRNKSAQSPLIIKPESLPCIRDIFEEWFEPYPDVLTAEQAAQATGYSSSSISHWCSRGKLHHYRIRGKNMIPKLALLDYVASTEFQNVRIKSKIHIQALKRSLENPNKQETANREGETANE